MLKNKKLLIIFILALLGILLIILGNNFSSTEKTSVDTESYTKELEKKIEGFLLSIDGINKAKVIITLESSQEQSYDDYFSISSGKNSADFDYESCYPSVRGVAIACTNGNNDEVKIKITKLITAYLGISSNRVEIVGIK